MNNAFIVYGTLRPGGRNYEEFLAANTIFEQNIQLEGFVMYAKPTYPYLAYGHGTITATLVIIHDDKYEQVLKNLDTLEYFFGESNPFNEYDRKLHSFILNDEPFQAWLYLISSKVHAEIKGIIPVVKSGDWLEHIKNKNTIHR